MLEIKKYFNGEDAEGRRDLIAIITIVMCFILLALGHNGVVTATLLTTTGYYFGRRHVVKK